MRSAAFDNWSAKARSVKIEDEIARRGIKLNGKIERVGPCPKCGGVDRFASTPERTCGIAASAVWAVMLSGWSNTWTIATFSPPARR